jgi:hypothetical protein
MSKCLKVMPALRGARVVKESVGVRPRRMEGIRMEFEEIKGCKVNKV